MTLFYQCKEKVSLTKNGEIPHIFKFKDGKDYSNNVFVILNEKKDRITGIKGCIKDSIMFYSTYKYYLDYYKGYYFEKQNFGINTGYLSISPEDYEKVCDTMTVETMWTLLIDKDPYSEYYYDEDQYLGNSCSECEGKDTTWAALDTAKFHRLVDNGELEKYLKRVK